MKAGQPRIGHGQTVLEPGEPILAPSEQLNALYQLSDPALSELGLEELLEELLDRVRRRSTSTRSRSCCYDADSQRARRPRRQAASRRRSSKACGSRSGAGSPAGSRPSASRSSSRDVDHADILNPILREKGIRSLLGVPLIVEGELIGVLHVGSLTPRTFGQRDARCAPAGGGASCARDRAGAAVTRRSSTSTRSPSRCSAACYRAGLPTSSGWRPPLATSLPARRWAATGTTCSSFRAGGSASRSATSSVTGCGPRR